MGHFYNNMLCAYISSLFQFKENAKIFKHSRNCELIGPAIKSFFFLWHKLCLCLNKTRCQHYEGQSCLVPNRSNAELFIYVLEKCIAVKIFL